MAELGCQIQVSERAWKVPGIRERSLFLLRRNLELANAHDIKIEAPEHLYIDGLVDEEGDWHPIEKPYWVWEVMATGETDA